MAALTIILLVLLPAHQALGTAAGDAHPGYVGAEADTCGPALGGSSSSSAGGAAGRRHGPELEEYGGGRIVDITHAYMPGKPAYATVGPVLRLKKSMENGSEYNLSELDMECHAGTHVDAPGHMNQAHFAAGLDVDTFDLEVLNDKNQFGEFINANYPRAADGSQTLMAVKDMELARRRAQHTAENPELLAAFANISIEEAPEDD